MANILFQKKYLPTILGSTLILLAAGNHKPFANLSQSSDKQEEEWVDSMFTALSEEERLGQLFMLSAHADKDTAYERQVEDLVRT